MINQTKVSNPFPPVFDERARVLILGSLPSETSRAAGFYYMNPRNRFWEVMSALFREDFTLMSAAEKSAALVKRGIALSDVISSCEIHRSSDASIKNAKCTDVMEILRRAHVEKILLNGGKAHALFLRFFPSLAPLAVCLPSTSPANARITTDELIERWREALAPFGQSE